MSRFDRIEYDHGRNAIDDADANTPDPEPAGPECICGGTGWCEVHDVCAACQLRHCECDEYDDPQQGEKA